MTALITDDKLYEEIKEVIKQWLYEGIDPEFLTARMYDLVNKRATEIALLNKKT